MNHYVDVLDTQLLFDRLHVRIGAHVQAQSLLSNSYIPRLPSLFRERLHLHQDFSLLHLLAVPLVVFTQDQQGSRRCTASDCLVRLQMIGQIIRP